MENRISNFYPLNKHDHITDDTSRMLEASLRESQVARYKAEANNRSKTDFLAQVSHEIRNSAGIMITTATLLSLSECLSVKQRDLIRTLLLGGESLTALLNDFLDVSKIEDQKMSLEMIPFNLLTVLEDVQKMMLVKAQSKGLELNINCASLRGKTFIGDPMRLRQMMINLLENAIKFTKTGAVSISTTSRMLASGQEETIIRVTDTGMGISLEQQKIIFEKFTQASCATSRQHGGTGLGLFITKKLTEEMGGMLDIRSTLGRGSTFSLSLPLPIVLQQPSNHFDRALSRKSHASQVSNDQMAFSTWATEGGKTGFNDQ